MCYTAISKEKEGSRWILFMKLIWTSVPIAAASAPYRTNRAGASDCGSHTVHAAYETPEERLAAAKQVAHLWNIGKVIHAGVGD